MLKTYHLDTLNAIIDTQNNINVDTSDYEEVTKYYISEEYNELIDLYRCLMLNDYIEALDWDCDYSQYYSTSENDINNVLEFLQHTKIEKVTTYKIVDTYSNEVLDTLEIKE